MSVCLSVGFLETINQADLLARRQSLPPLQSLKLNPLHSPSHDSESPNVSDSENQKLINEETDVPIPGEQQELALTPGGSFSPGVNELIESFKHPTRAIRRSESTGSGQGFRQHRRQGSNGSAKACTLERTRKCDSRTGTPARGTPVRGTPVRGTPVRGRSRSNSICSQKAALDNATSATASGVLYSRLDGSGSDTHASADGSDTQASTDSENNGEAATSTSSAYPESSLQSATITRALNSSHSKSHKPSLGLTVAEREVTIADSAADVAGTGTDGHEADSESNAADCESAGEEEETSPDRFSESSEMLQSPSPVETSDSNTDLLARPEGMEWLPESSLGSVLARSNRTKSSTERTFESENPIPAVSSTRSSVASLISHFENSSINSDGNQSETGHSGTSTPKLQIPLHIRRKSEVETYKYTGSYSPASVDKSLNPALENALKELGGPTVFVRAFHENVGSKSRAPGLQMQSSNSSTEFEDSGIQVRGDAIM